MTTLQNISAVELSQNELNMVEGGTFGLIAGLVGGLLGGYCAPKPTYCAPAPKPTYCAPAPKPTHPKC